MLSNNEDIAFQNFRKLQAKFRDGLSEADTRDKIIDPLFRDCLGWTEDNIRREPYVNQGYLDYVFSFDEMDVFILEAKRVGHDFIVPDSLNRRQYKISGILWDNQDIRKVLLQAQKYASDLGVKFAVISNGHQFIIFEAFRPGGWKNGSCVIFRSLLDIQENFIFFMNILSKDGVSKGSFHTYISKKRPILKFEKPLSFFNYEDQKVSQNNLARLLNPFIKTVFGEIIDEQQQDVLKKCYVRQRRDTYARDIIKPYFDTLPHYADKFGIENFIEGETHAGKFQLSFEKCEKFLRQEHPSGSLILLLGGIGSGKTTFIHHFFNVTLERNKNILWFYVDFREASPDHEKIEEHIYNKIIENYEKRYQEQFKKELAIFDFSSPSTDYQDILKLFTLLIFKGYTISLVLDNVDQYSLTSPKYQERVFLVSQHLTKNLKTITILTLREESFFKSTRSGVINAYNTAVNTFHISSPRFDQIIRRRINYVLNLLRLEDEKISLILHTWMNLGANKIQLQLLFKIIKQSIDRTRGRGREILYFIDDVSGGNIRTALYFFNKFITSGNTDVDEMLEKETYSGNYLIPFHHVIKSIILEDSRYFSMNQSQVMNIFDINPEYTNSHLIHLRVLNYLKNRINNYSSIETGYLDISSLLYDAQIADISQMAVIDSIKKLAEFGLIEFDNQSKSGYKDASYIRITKTGLYYFNKLINKFVYLDLMWGSTPICDIKVVEKLKNVINVDTINDDIQRMNKRFDRTEIFLYYLKDMENQEWKNYPELKHSTFSSDKYIEQIIKQYFEEKTYILERMDIVRKRYR
jgi:KaiC/GvpD/RAD55 family RecA-like ATPase